MILACHGIVNNCNATSLLHKNMIDRKKFYLFLKNLNYKLVDIEVAINGNGNALTIDDATYASASAALLAKKMGHEVTIFINPYNIENSKTLFSSLINVAVETFNEEYIIIENCKYLAITYSHKKQIRKLIKEKILELNNEHESLNLLQNIFKGFNLNLKVPYYLKTISKNHLYYLQGRGIRIENHGWMHSNLFALNSNAIRDNIQLSKDWLYNELKIISNFYAVPYGLALPDNYNEKLVQTWLTLDPDYSEGYRNSLVYNRKSLSI